MDSIFYFQEKKRTNSVSKSVKTIVSEAERLEVMDKAVMVLAELLFDENMLTQIPQHSTLFKKVIIVDNASVLISLEKYLIAPHLS